MIDGLFKKSIDPLWESLARPLASSGVTPNQVTVIGLLLICVNVAAFLLHGSKTLFGCGLAIAFAFDALDGAVARLTGLSSKRGGYLDAITDRYQELIVMLAFGWATNAWLAVLLGVTGAYLTSYAKARTALEIKVSNDGWPDFFERQERIFFLCGLPILAGTVFGPLGLQTQALVTGLWIYAGLTHFTALQRARRAWSLLTAVDRADRRVGSGHPADPD